MGFITCIMAFIMKGSLTPEYVLPLFMTYLLPSPISEKLKGATISKNNTKTNNNVQSSVETSTSDDVVELLDGGYEEKI